MARPGVRARQMRALVTALPVVFGMGCSLLPLQMQTSGFGEPEPVQVPAENRAAARAAEAEKEDAAEDTRVEEIQAELAALRAKIAEGKDLVADARSFADLVIEARRTKAARAGEMDVGKLETEAVGYLDKALEKAPSLELFDVLVNAAVRPEDDGVGLG
ncbi:MAG TPA: hypothetical protein VM694_09365, partial [Polyangium sp.]|nr:hypothetical protein [Polyangium sp.]